MKQGRIVSDTGTEVDKSLMRKLVLKFRSSCCPRLWHGGRDEKVKPKDKSFGIRVNSSVLIPEWREPGLSDNRFLAFSFWFEGGSPWKGTVLSFLPGHSCFPVTDPSQKHSSGEYFDL